MAEGLASSKYDFVILSPRFLSKQWPQNGLNGLFAKEIEVHKTIATGRQRRCAGHNVEEQSQK